MRRNGSGTVTTVKLPKTFIRRLKVVTGEQKANRAVRIVCEEGIRFAKRQRLKALAGTFRLPYFEASQRLDRRRDQRLR
jgi:hypothetical protein